MAINYSLSKKNLHLDKDNGDGKLYATAQHNGVVKTEEFVRKMCQACGTLDPGTVQSVLTTLADCMRRELLNGYRVEAGPLGDFYAVINGTGSTKRANFARSNIKDVKVNWAPGKNLRNLMKDAKFRLVKTRQVQKDAVRRDKKEISEKQAAQAVLDGAPSN